MIDCLLDDNDNDDDSDDDSNDGSDNDNDEDGDGWQTNKWTKQQNNNRKNTLHCVRGSTNKQKSKDRKCSLQSSAEIKKIPHKG